MSKTLALPDYAASDRLILSNAREPISVIAEMTGLAPEYCAERLQELLNQRDHLTDRQEERLLLIEMSALVNEAREKLRHVGEDNWADTANVALRGYDSLAKRMDERRRANAEDEDKITAGQGARTIELIRVALNYAGEEIATAHPEFDPMELNMAFSKALPIAREELRKHVISD